MTLLRAIIAPAILAPAILAWFPLYVLAQNADQQNMHIADVAAGKELSNIVAGNNTAYSGSLFGLTKQQKKRARSRYKQDLKLLKMQNMASASYSANANEKSDGANKQSPDTL